MSILLYHNIEFRPLFDSRLQNNEHGLQVTRRSSECVEIKVGTCGRPLCFFPGMSAQNERKMVRLITGNSFSGHVLEQSGAFDDIKFTTSQGEFRVIYSISHDAPLCRAMTGPESMSLYNPNTHTFGPVIVYSRDAEIKSMANADVQEIHDILAQLSPILPAPPTVKSAN